MKSEKKELVKKYKAVIEDLLDNYEKYTDEEKAKIKEIFQNAADLNSLLDKYDIETEFDIEDYIYAINRYFDTVYYIK